MIKNHVFKAYFIAQGNVQPVVSEKGSLQSDFYHMITTVTLKEEGMIFGYRPICEHHVERR